MNVRTVKTVEEGVKSAIMSVGVSMIEYCPGNGTRYVVALSHLAPEACRTILGARPEALLVSVLAGPTKTSAAIFQPEDGFLSASYVAERLGLLDSPTDAAALTELLGHVLRRPTEDFGESDSED